MAIDDIVGELAQRGFIATGGEILERADADVAGGDAGEDRARHEAFAHDLLASCHRRQSASGGDAEGVHRLANEVFPQDRAEGGAAIATAGKWCGTGAFELDVAADAVCVNDFA